MTTAYPLDPKSYRLLYEVGSGVSAVVYKAACLHHPSSSPVVAIKSIDLERSRANLDDVRREAKAMALLSHPNVLRAHCSFTVDRHLWVVMPFMAAGSLHSILASAFPAGLPEASIAFVLRDTLLALSYLHGQGHIHRDIKAGNILVDSDGSVKLADFGVSASIYESHSATASASASFFNDVAGTPYWMAPEVLHSHLGYGIKADIWSFGITALELAHGRPPLSHLPLSKSLMMKITNRLRFEDHHGCGGGGDLDKIKKKKFSKAFKDMVAACLCRDPSKRPSADKLLRHPFFKNCKSNEYFVKNVLHAVPAIHERCMEKMNNIEEVNIDYDHATTEGSASPLVKNRRISGWNFNENVLALDPVYPPDIDDKSCKEEDHHKEATAAKADQTEAADCHQDQEKTEAADAKKQQAMVVVKQTLVPNLASLLSSLELQRGMVMEVLSRCGRCCTVVDGGGGGKRPESEMVMMVNLRDQKLWEYINSLQRTVDDLKLQLLREMKRNADLEAALTIKLNSY
ncbi:serine/threonine-protein kinase BLUS1-like [Zingiber officinale]|uniref:Protein kinase domain-containing protein n=1 Tax=Zingiber officinale TaxID=94328 RepID=A0A8J5FKV3_ZINOF|nr:serine/threonine-protein kinase BLUS1-like [Zingiber officinale]KAG6488978.1 hypothetical protein ZIOFF_050236 [Zingiber officinale]